MFGKKLKALVRWAIEVNTEKGPNQQRGQLLAFYLGFIILAIIALITINIPLWLINRTVFYTRIAYFDFLTLIWFIILWYLNRKGKTLWAAHLSLIVVVIGTNFIFEPQDLIHGFSFLTIPIIMSSFVLAAGWAFVYTTLIVIVYTSVYLFVRPSAPYEYLVVVSLYAYAGISYLIASRYNYAMQSVRTSEERFRTFFDRVPVGLYRTTADGDVLEANPTLLKMFGYQDFKSFQKLNASDLYVKSEDHEGWLDDFMKYAIEDKYITETQFKRRDGTVFWASDATRAVYDESGNLLYYEGSLTDISKRKMAEEAMRKSEERFRHIFENATVGLYRTTPAGDILLANQTLIKMLGYKSLKELAARNLETDGFEPEYPRSDFQKKVESEGEIHGLEAVWKRKDGTTIYVRESAKVVHDESGRVLYYEGTVEDITERKLAEFKIQEQIDQLTALRKIDTTISSTTDLQLSLETILNEAVRLLGVDAADIMLLNSNLYRLDYAAGVGFHTKNIEKRNVRLGAGRIGKAALDNKKIEMHKIKTDSHTEFTELSGENISCYRCVPLMVKGKIQGIMEIYYRRHDNHPVGKQGFLEALAGQTAIAIDNAKLFDDLQQSNFELTIAYDQAIEGWSQALDLREDELGNHTKNVTEMTLRLASSLGYQDKDLLYIRYGSLLHDIGKMGIPDHILLKPGKLTNEEWEVVRQHPQIAFDLLKRIPYLRPALDIPYAHHEKWDGSGYPRGLAGNDIPRTARIFAVADVYDALISDRPFRKKWTKRKAIEYIRDQSGKQFDPEVVRAFLREIGHS